MSSQKVVLTEQIAPLRTINEDSYKVGSEVLEHVGRQMDYTAFQRRVESRCRIRSDSADSMMATPILEGIPPVFVPRSLDEHFSNIEQKVPLSNREMSVDEDPDLSYVHCLESLF